MVDATDNAEKQAKAQLESIVSMVNRLEHAGTCGGEDCELERDVILEGVNIWPGNTITDEELAEYKDQYHDEDKAREQILEDPLSVELRSGWHEVGGESEDEEYKILLCTGGPAVRIIGELDQYGQASTARLEYQDWFTPWSEYATGGDTALLAYANQFLGG